MKKIKNYTVLSLNKFNLLLIFISSLLLNILNLKSQEREIIPIKQNALWNGLYIRLRVSEKFNYYAEHHYRLKNTEANQYLPFAQTNRIYNRLGINYIHNDYFEFVLGPVFVLLFDDVDEKRESSPLVIEPRIWHQYLFITPKIGRFKFYHQIRIEHRWRNFNLKSRGIEYNDRFRYKLSAYIPIDKKKIEIGSFYFVPSVEIFLQSGKFVRTNPFEDVRFYNGIGYVYNEKITFFAGHMFTIGQLPSGIEYNFRHIWRLNIFLGIDFRKIENQIPKINIGY